NIEEIQRLVHWAAGEKIPLTARGSGTGLTGGAVTPHGGIVVSLSRLNSVLEIDAASRQVTLQPGVITASLQKLLAPYNLYYPPDPASQSVSTLGGNIAENAGGPHCLKYGVTGNYVLGLDVVLSDGQAVQLGGKALDPPEYDLVGLITGSEGTLGIVTAATLGLRQPPEAVKTLTATFRSVAEAGAAVSAVIGARILPATIELMDGGMLTIVEAYLQAGFPTNAGAMLIFDVDGSEDSLSEQLDEIAAVVKRYYPLEIQIARTSQERELLWRGRRSAAGAMSRISPNEYSLDVTLPRSRLELCAAMGGSIGGEHGIGMEKRSFLSTMYNPNELAAMLEVKHAFDPGELLNPGKIFPPDFQAPAGEAAPTGVTPATLFTPASPLEAAQGLRLLQAARQPTFITGGGTIWQGAVSSHSVRLSTDGLRGISRLSTDDQYVTALAGTPVRELQAALAEQGFWIPLTHTTPGASIGGAIAANANGPLRMLYGSLRDQLLACQVALPDGRLLRFGRPLVKDVAGYAMSKLFIGSYGTLGLLAEVTMKIWPLPAARRSLAVNMPNLVAAVALAQQTLKHTRICSGLIITHQAPETNICYTAEGHPADVKAELGYVRRTLIDVGAQKVQETETVDADTSWEEILDGGTSAVRMGVPPNRLAETLPVAETHLAGSALILDAANGILIATLSADNAEQASRVLAGLRSCAEIAGGYAILARAPRQWLRQMDAWGAPRPAADLMRRLKVTWDPAGILNPGEFPAS
ncbi:MAG: D-lactate dehydrogenase (cytochrome), partial [Chloroflexi bacterium]|nr:D-lactate dehydrogenase (cytochrome) [Chloroflexota bacterium]